ncbi:MAG: AAA family ATPase, partial [Patescibacteria group bacterium]
NPGIAAIVGPNGAGKSNTADAVRWVLGEQSLKTLRGKKSEDVIFSGSNKKARLGFAEVALYLNNEDKKAAVDYTHIEVKRRLYRDGTSEYLINGNKVRLADVQILLAQANFGHRTYSVIGQGMVDAILSASPHERKDFFDEATGVKQYQIKREQALNKIAATEENLIQINALLKEITPRLRHLERQAEKLAKRGNIETNLRTLQKQYYSYLWHKTASELETLQDKKKALSAKQHSLKTEVDALQSKLGSLEKHKTDNKAYEALEKTYQLALQKKSEQNGELKGLERQLQALKDQAKAAPFSIDTAALIKAADKHLVFLHKIINAKNVLSLTSIQGEAKTLHQELEKITKQPLSNDPLATQAAQDLLKHIGELKDNVDKLADDVIKAEQAMNSARHKEREATTEVFAIQRAYQDKQHHLTSLNNEVNALAVNLARLETQQQAHDQEMDKELSQEFKKEIKNHPPTPSLVKEGVHAEDANLWPQIARAKHELEMIGGIDSEVAAEFTTTRDRHTFLSAQNNDLQDALEKTKQVEKELQTIIEKEFDTAFAKIETGFKEYFSLIFSGGNASLELHKENELDNLSEEMAATLSAEETDKLAHTFNIGIDIKASPPGKRVASIAMLSGGERALTSIALICAIIRANPSPFVVLDEVDAALDEANSERFAAILEKLSHYTQFIAITHNRATMERANILYGVTMGDDGVSKLLSVDLEKAVRTADLHR